MSEVSDVYCDWCNRLIDPDTCHCGQPTAGHGFFDGHNPVPMGCVCGYLAGEDYIEKIDNDEKMNEPD